MSRAKKDLTVEEKFDVIRKMDKGAHAIDIARASGLSQASVLSTHKMKEQVLKIAEKGTVLPNTTQIKLVKRSLRKATERTLLQWIDDMYMRRKCITHHDIMAVAQIIYKDLEEQKGQPSEYWAFLASFRWYENFKKRCNVGDRLYKKFASKVVPVEIFPQMLNAIIKENGYTTKQIFFATETGLYWKRMPARTSIFDDKMRTRGFETSRDGLMLLLGGNAEGDCKLKPMVNYFQGTPKSLKGIDKSGLPVLWKSNKDSQFTKKDFKEWLEDCALPTFKAYCTKENFDYKILLVIDSATVYNLNYEMLCPEVEIVFVPPNVSSLQQTIQEGVIASFRAYYLLRTFHHLSKETQDKEWSTLGDFWKSFSIRHAISIIRYAWEDVTPQSMKGVWHKLLPDLIHNFKGFSIDFIIKKIVEFAQHIGFPEIGKENVVVLLESHSESMVNGKIMSIDDLSELDEQSSSEEEMEEGEEQEQEEEKEKEKDKEEEEIELAAEGFHNIALTRIQAVLQRFGDGCYKEFYTADMQPTSHTSTSGISPRPLPSVSYNPQNSSAPMVTIKQETFSSTVAGAHDPAPVASQCVDEDRMSFTANEEHQEEEDEDGRGYEEEIGVEGEKGEDVDGRTQEEEEENEEGRTQEVEKFEDEEEIWMEAESLAIPVTQTIVEPQVEPQEEHSQLGDRNLLQRKKYELRNNCDHFGGILASLAQDEIFMDVTLTAEGQSVKAHKSVLSAMSPYFREVLSNNPCQHPVIIMPFNVSLEDLQSVINFIYKGEMTVCAERVDSILQIGEILKIKGLCERNCFDIQATSEAINPLSVPEADDSISVTSSIHSPHRVSSRRKREHELRTSYGHSENLGSALCITSTDVEITENSTTSTSGVLLESNVRRSKRRSLSSQKSSASVCNILPSVVVSDKEHLEPKRAKISKGIGTSSLADFRKTSKSPSGTTMVTRASSNHRLEGTLTTQSPPMAREVEAPSETQKSWPSPVSQIEMIDYRQILKQEVPELYQYHHV